MKQPLGLKGMEIREKLLPDERLVALLPEKTKRKTKEWNRHYKYHFSMEKFNGSISWSFTSAGILTF